MQKLRRKLATLYEDIEYNNHFALCNDKNKEIMDLQTPITLLEET